MNNFTPNLEHVIKLWVDECTGKFIDPITVTDAVITKHGKTLTEVLDLIFGNLRQNKDLLNALKLRVEDLEAYKVEFDRLKALFEVVKENYASKADVACIAAELQAISAQLLNNQGLFLQILQYLTSGNQGGGINIDLSDLDGYLKTTDLLNAVRALNTFVEKVHSDLTEITYPPYGGIISLPPTVGGALYVADNPDAGHRFYFTLNGDVNGDGFTNASDITALYNWLLYNDSSQLVNPDLNSDGHITAGDVTIVYDILLNGLKVTQIGDKLNPGNTYELPEGTIFVNGRNIYNVKNGLAELIGIIPGINDTVNIQYTVPVSYQSPQGSPAIGPMHPQIPEEITSMVEAAEVEAVRSDIIYEKADKIVNAYIVALHDKSTDTTLAQKVEAVEASIEDNTFDPTAINYNYLAIESKWEGLPQDTAQGLAFAKGTWNDGVNDQDIQYVQPLGSFKDFKRIFNDPNKRTVAVSMFGNDGLYNPDLTPFIVTSFDALGIANMDGEEDSTILAVTMEINNLESNLNELLETTTLYLFYWNGLDNKYPVIIEANMLGKYLDITLESPGIFIIDDQV